MWNSCLPEPVLEQGNDIFFRQEKKKDEDDGLPVDRALRGGGGNTVSLVERERKCVSNHNLST